MMQETVAQEKQRLRHDLKSRMSAMPSETRHESDEALFRTLLSLEVLKQAKTVLLFYGIGTEPDTKRLIPQLFAARKRVLLPRCLADRQMEAREIGPDSVLSAAPKAFMIPEPSVREKRINKEEIDLILVPCLCCDAQGYRLGQGGGYYDRYLADYRGITVSLCREDYLQQALPRAPHDQPVQIIVTEGAEHVPKSNK